MLSRFLTHRYTLIAFNLLFLLISSYTMAKAAMMMLDGMVNPEEVDDLLDGVGVIFVAYGVALEGRGMLMVFLGLYPRHQNSREETVDRICEYYGLLLVIGGLLMEVAAEVVLIPTHFLEIPKVEAISFWLGFAAWLGVVCLVVRMSYLLIKCDPGYLKIE